MASAAVSGVRLGLGRGECLSAPAPALRGRWARPYRWKDPQRRLPRSPQRFRGDFGGSGVPGVFPGPAHPRLRAIKAFRSAERCRDRAGKERSGSSTRAGEKQRAHVGKRGMFVPCSSLLSSRHHCGAPGTAQSPSLALVLGAVRGVSSAGSLNAGVMVAFQLTACNCQQSFKNQMPSVLGFGWGGRADGGGHRGAPPVRPARLGVPAGVEVPKKGAVAAS